MHDFITLDECPDLRAKVEDDDYPDPPYNDGASPMLRVFQDYRREPGWHARQVRSGMSYELDSYRILDAAERWAVDEPEKFERYMRIFHGSTSFAYDSQSSDGWHITFDTAHWRNAMGLTDEHIAKVREAQPDVDFALANMDEYLAFLQGDCYVISVERRVWKATISEDFEVDEDSVDDEWECVDSCGGFYGGRYGYVEERAEEMIREAV